MVADIQFYEARAYGADASPLRRVALADVMQRRHELRRECEAVKVRHRPQHNLGANRRFFTSTAVCWLAGRRSLARSATDPDIRAIIDHQRTELEARRASRSAEEQVLRKEIAGLEESIGGFRAQVKAAEQRMALNLFLWTNTAGTCRLTAQFDGG